MIMKQEKSATNSSTEALPEAASKKILLTHIPESTSASNIKGMFGECGTIAKIQISSVAAIEFVTKGEKKVQNHYEPECHGRILKVRLNFDEVGPKAEDEENYESLDEKVFKKLNLK